MRYTSNSQYVNYKRAASGAEPLPTGGAMSEPRITNILGPKSMLSLADKLAEGIMFGHDHSNTQDELDRWQAAHVLRWLARQMQAQEYVMGMVEDYGQWMWDSGYMDSPTGETLVDDAYHKRQEIREAMLAWKAKGAV